jgi:spermidine/putrescine transport system permease protein
MKSQAKDSLSWLVAPGLIWYFAFFLIPLALIFATSFLTRGTYGGIDWVFQIETYQRIYDPAYLGIFWRSIKLSLFTTVSCGLIAIPLAWVIATSTVKWRFFWLVVISLPFFMNLITRIYAIRQFMAYEGPLVSFLNLLGMQVDPFLFSQNQWLTMYGMITTYLPFMVFPIYSALDKLDWSLAEACQDLGGSQFTFLIQIMLPLIKPALSVGALMVFVPALGEFVIPDLLGGAKVMLIGNLITDQFLKSRDWPFGATLTVHLIFILSFISFAIIKWGRSNAR